LLKATGTGSSSGVVLVPEQFPEVDVLAAERDNRRVIVRVKRRPDHHVRHRLNAPNTSHSNRSTLF